MSATNGGCMTPDCRATNVVCRGLCRNCYAMATRIVATKVSTWSELEAMELALPAKQAHLSAFRAAFKARKNGGKAPAT